MKVMLLAAGKGTRMQPLTAHTPKPLLRAGGMTLIEHQIHKLARAGFDELVINHAWLGEQLEQALGDGAALGVNIQWSREKQPLETAGGIIQALPLLGEEPFAVVNADVWTDYPFEQLRHVLKASMQAHLVLVPNPTHHPKGDFVLCEGKVQQPEYSQNYQSYTFSGIAVYRPVVFAGVKEKKYPLLPLLNKAIAHSAASGELFTGTWIDIGTPQRLHELDQHLSTDLSIDSKYGDSNE